MINNFYKSHVISINEISRLDLEIILNLAKYFKNNAKLRLLRNKIIAICFFESSTRTRLSFETAIHRLGASVVGFSDSNNIALSKKGETLSDTISVISNYVDAIIIRHPQEGSARLASEFSNSIPIINAGDGSNQHPTQTILDLFTIKETQGRLNNLSIAVAGDLKYGRTVHSLIQALAKFDNNKFYFISPDALSMPNNILSILEEQKLYYSIHNNMKIISEVDIFYMTRIQKERLDPSEYINLKSRFIIRRENLYNVRSNMKIMHPLPRTDEISTEVDQTPYAYYFQQAGNGIYTRQALLASILCRELPYYYDS